MNAVLLRLGRPVLMFAFWIRRVLLSMELVRNYFSSLRPWLPIRIRPMHSSIVKPVPHPFTLAYSHAFPQYTHWVWPIWQFLAVYKWPMLLPVGFLWDRRGLLWHRLPGGIRILYWCHAHTYKISCALCFSLSY